MSKSVNAKIRTPKKRFNNIPPSLFSVKSSRILSTIFILFSFVIAIAMLILSFFGIISFTQVQLKEMAEFTLNLVFVVSALGLATFTLPIKNNHPKKEDIMKRYIGSSLLIASVSIFAYVLSYCDFLSNYKFISIFSLYFCGMLFLTCLCMLNIISTIIAYFNIQD